jgi:hypothetical protein
LLEVWFEVLRRQKAESRRQKAEGRRQKAEADGRGQRSHCGAMQNSRLMSPKKAKARESVR